MIPKILVKGRGLAYLLGLGAIILAYIDNENWKYFLASALLLFILPMLIRKKKHKKKKHKKKRHKKHRR